MKKISALALALLMVAALASCGSSQTAKKEKSVDLDDFYEDLADEYDWEENDMVSLTDDLLDNYYPGLKNISTKQMVTEVPQMSSVVNELAFVECSHADDAKKVAEIFQKRIDDQADGGAMYPESLAAWEKAGVVTNGKYVAMIASAEHQSEIEKEFKELFA